MARRLGVSVTGPVRPLTGGAEADFPRFERFSEEACDIDLRGFAFLVEAQVAAWRFWPYGFPCNKVLILSIHNFRSRVDPARAKRYRRAGGCSKLAV